ncbi:MAG: hypothetical protein C0524_13505 [Rhodobacter sp.]|nr:hypothetical protein [Rhodobacter sp.]
MPQGLQGLVNGGLSVFHPSSICLPCVFRAVETAGVNSWVLVWGPQRSLPMPNLRNQTPRQRAQMSYMMDVMRRLEWDLHNSIEMTGRIPEEWHEIAQETPRAEKVKVNLRLEADVVKFFKSMGPDYGPRINDVLKTYMHARLAGVIRGAETIAHHRRREEGLDGPKPQFGDLERELGEPWEDEGPPVVQAARVKVQEAMQRKYAVDGGPEELVQWVR